MVKNIAIFLGILKNVWVISDFKSACIWTMALFTKAPNIFKEKSLAPADKAVRGMATFRFPNQRFVKIRGDFGGPRELYCQRVYEPDPRFSIQPSWIVIDLGAHKGLYGVMAAVRGAKTVIAVEAQGNCLPEILKFAELNGVAEHIVMVHAMVGSRTGIFANEDNREKACYWTTDPHLMSVEELFESNKIDRCDIMKIDIEGSEFSLFDEGTEWLLKVDRIVAEVHTEFGDSQKLRDIFVRAGFKAFLTDHRHRRVEDLFKRPGYCFAVRT